MVRGGGGKFFSSPTLINSENLSSFGHLVKAVDTFWGNGMGLHGDTFAFHLPFAYGLSWSLSKMKTAWLKYAHESNIWQQCLKVKCFKKNDLICVKRNFQGYFYIYLLSNHTVSTPCFVSCKKQMNVCFLWWVEVGCNQEGPEMNLKNLEVLGIWNFRYGLCKLKFWKECFEDW